MLSGLCICLYLEIFIMRVILVHANRKLFRLSNSLWNAHNLDKSNLKYTWLHLKFNLSMYKNIYIYGIYQSSFNTQTNIDMSGYSSISISLQRMSSIIRLLCKSSRHIIISLTTYTLNNVFTT